MLPSAWLQNCVCRGVIYVDNLCFLPLANGFQNYYTYKLKNYRFLGLALRDSDSVVLRGARKSVAPLGDARRKACGPHFENQDSWGSLLVIPIPTHRRLNLGNCFPSTCYDDVKVDIDFTKLLFDQSSFLIWTALANFALKRFLLFNNYLVPVASVLYQASPRVTVRMSLALCSVASRQQASRPQSWQCCPGIPGLSSASVTCPAVSFSQQKLQPVIVCACVFLEPQGKGDGRSWFGYFPILKHSSQTAGYDFSVSFLF